MELDLEMGDLIENISDEKEIRKLIKKSMEGMAMEWEKSAKMIISGGALDTGEFVNSIHFEMFESKDEVGFIGMDGVDYGVFWEYGTVKHFVPFYRHNDTSQPVLADWGRRVLKLTQTEMLKMGGLQVKIPELSPFMKAMLKAQTQAAEIFKETFSE